MKEIHLNERIALGKLAEHISSNSMINGAILFGYPKCLEYWNIKT